MELYCQINQQDKHRESNNQTQQKRDLNLTDGLWWPWSPGGGGLRWWGGHSEGVHGVELGPKLLIGVVLTSCNYSSETRRSLCSGFNKRAITQTHNYHHQHY